MAAYTGGDDSKRSPIADALDRLPVSPWQYVLILALLSAMVLDGFDVKLLSYAAPLIIDEWGMSKAGFAPALAAAMIGMAIGSSLGGWIGDRIGRRLVIVWAVIGFGAMTVASGFAEDALALGFFRLLAGIGFGAVLPNSYALIAEWLPHRLQSRVIAVLAVATPTGGMIGAGITLFLLPLYGWRGCFMIAGAMTMLVGLILLFWLPESARFSFLKGRTDRVHRDWRKLMGDAPLALNADAVEPVAGELQYKPSTSAIFKRQFLRLNLGIALAGLTGTFAIYIFQSWMPVMLVTAGLKIGDAIQGSFVLNLFAVICGLSSGELIRYFGSRAMYVIWSGLMLAGLGVIAMVLGGGVAGGGGSGKLLLLAALGAYGGGGGGFVSALSANLTAAYPIEVRATGIGFGVTFARLGMITSIFAGGGLLTLANDDPTALLLTAGAALTLVIVGAFIVDRHIPPRRPVGRPLDASTEPLVAGSSRAGW